MIFPVNRSIAMASTGNKLKMRINSFFCIEDHGTTISTEIRAGITSFLTVSYILVVNSKVMAATSVTERDALTGTILSSFASSAIVGLFGNSPFALCPGLGLSAYLSYGLVVSEVLSLKEAQTCVLISGILTGAMALTGLNTVVMNRIPQSVKMGTVIGMGALIALIGMTSVDLVVSNDDTLVALGPMDNIDVIVSLIGVILIGTLIQAGVTGGLLIGMIVLTILVWTMNPSVRPDFDVAFSVPGIDTMPWQYFDFGALRNGDRLCVMIPAILSFHIAAVLDISGVTFGLSTFIKEASTDEVHVCNSTPSFVASSIGTVIASCTGSSPIIIAVESTAGIREGGRTGLTAVTVAILFLSTTFFQPLLLMIPSAATAPVLIFVGTMMVNSQKEILFLLKYLCFTKTSFDCHHCLLLVTQCVNVYNNQMGGSKNIDWDCTSEAISAFLTIIMMPFTYSITNGILFGLGSSAMFYITTGEMYCNLKSYWKEKTDILSFSNAETIPLKEKSDVNVLA